jgi:hypothetical protein
VKTLKLIYTKILIRLLESILILFFLKGGSVIKFLTENQSININYLDLLLVIIFFSILYSNDLREHENVKQNENKS